MSRVTQIEIVVALLVIGYIAALPVMRWALEDARSISRRVWATLGRHRSVWERRLFIAYALGGYPAIVYAFVWRSGRLRHELRRERAVERDRGMQ